MSVNPYPNLGINNAVMLAWTANASNVRLGTNAAYTVAMFLEDFPQFTIPLPAALLSMFITMASATVMENRWHESWRYGMGLFIAHFATLAIQGMAQGADSTAAQVITGAQARGLATSKSVGDVSVSYDFSTISSGLDGWAMFTSTTYGLQFSTMARLLGRAGMYLY